MFGTLGDVVMSRLEVPNPPIPYNVQNNPIATNFQA